MQTAVGYGIRADVGILLGANALVVAVGGDRKALVAIVGLNLSAGASVDGVKIWWDTKDGAETIAGKYTLLGRYGGDGKGTFVYDNPKDSIETFERTDGRKMYIQNAGVGLSKLFDAKLIVVSLGIPAGSPRPQVEKAFEKWKKENGQNSPW